MLNKLTRAIAATAVMLAAGPAVAQPAAADLQAKVDAIFKRWTPTTPGCAVGADVKGQPVIRRGYGLADLEHEEANRPDTIFESGSVAKQANHSGRSVGSRWHTRSAATSRSCRSLPGGGHSRWIRCRSSWKSGSSPQTGRPQPIGWRRSR